MYEITVGNKVYFVGSKEKQFFIKVFKDRIREIKTINLPLSAVPL